MFEMDDAEQHQLAFEMDDDYGFYVEADDDAAADHNLMPIPSDEESAESTPYPSPLPPCGYSRIHDENAPSLLTSPPILSPAVVDAIAEDGLPWSMQDAKWDRLFSSSRDGASFGAFMRRVRGHGQTVIVARTSDGRVVGGYATDVWSGRKQQQQPGGSSSRGRSFLFTVEPPAAMDGRRDAAAPMAAAHTFIPGLEDLYGTSPTSALDFDFHGLSMKHSDVKTPPAVVEIFKPSRGDASFKQACKIGNKFISMSAADNSRTGGGPTCLMIEDSFSRGRMGENEEEFTIVEFEAYGFSED